MAEVSGLALARAATRVLNRVLRLVNHWFVLPYRLGQRERSGWIRICHGRVVHGAVMVFWLRKSKAFLRFFGLSAAAIDAEGKTL